MSLFIRLLLIVILSGGHSSAYAASGQDAQYDWMNASIKNMGSSVSSCLYAPKFTSLHTHDYLLNLDQTGKWVPTQVYLHEGKLLQMEWNTRFVQPRPDKYRVMYRIDPRFVKPQIFIQRFNYDQNKYISDFHQFKNGQLLKYQEFPEMTFGKHIDDITEYFNFNGRDKIKVKKDDVINIYLDHTGQYFDGQSEMSKDIGTGDDLMIIYSHTPIKDNSIIYSDTDKWCNSFGPSWLGISCQASGVYSDTINNWKTFTGRIDNNVFDAKKNSFLSCIDSANGKANPKICYYDKGRGMQIKLAGTTIKPITEKFAHSDVTNGDFFYYKSDTDGELDFVTEWEIDGMYNGPSQLFKDWKGGLAQYSVFSAFMNAAKPLLTMNFLHFGRYLMNIEVGNSVETVPKAEIDAIEVEYIIMQDGRETPRDDLSGNTVDRDFRTDANVTGFLWLRVLRPTDNMTGTVQVKTMNYTGTTWFSDVVYGGLVKPLRTKFNELSMILYHKFVSDPVLQNIARTMLVIYIIVYGLMFLAGATEIKAIDIVQRVLKIAVILVLFSETSWTFFNNNLFAIFVDGTDYLFSAVVGVTSSAENVFGFIDPIFDKYTNGRVWALLFIQLLQIHNGLAFFAIMMIYSILIYFRAIIEIIVSYCLAFLGIAVMISLAPFFIILILFERTKSIFDNWISTLFGYMIKPTLLLIFFLLIDQIMTEHLAQAVITACWGILIPITIGIDLNHMGIPLSFSFTLPFFPGIPFYIPQVSPITSVEGFFTTRGTFAMVATSSLLFFLLCKLARGLVDYVEIVATMLTGTIAARQYGGRQQGSTMVHQITGDMSKAVSPVTNAIKGAGKSIKRKVVGQKIDQKSISRDREKGKLEKSGDIDYSKVKKGGSGGGAGGAAGGASPAGGGGAAGAPGAGNAGGVGAKNAGLPGVKPAAKPGQLAAKPQLPPKSGQPNIPPKPGQPNIPPKLPPKPGQSKIPPKLPPKPGQPAPKPQLPPKPGQLAPNQNPAVGNGLAANAMHKGGQGGGLGAPKANPNKAVGGAVPEAPPLNAPPKKPKAVQRKNSNKLKGDSD